MTEGAKRTSYMKFSISKACWLQHVVYRQPSVIFFCLLVFLFADFHFLFIPWVLKTNNYQTTLYCSFPFPLHLMYFASESLKHLIWKKMIMVSVFRLPWKGWGDTEHTTFLCIQVLYFHNQEHVESLSLQQVPLSLLPSPFHYCTHQMLNHSVSRAWDT